MELGTFGVELETFGAVEVGRRGAVKRKSERNGAPKARSGVPISASLLLGALPEQAERRKRNEPNVPTSTRTRLQRQTEDANVTQISGLAFFREIGVVERAPTGSRTVELNDGARQLSGD